MIRQACGNNNVTKVFSDFLDFVASVGKDMNVENSRNGRGTTGAGKQRLIIGGLSITLFPRN